VSPSPDSDGCAKVLAEGLAPGGTYWYRFLADGGVSSPVGRTRTTAAARTTPGAVRFAVGSCQSYAAGYYPAWRAVSQLDLDAVIHLGDYIYESTGGGPLGGVREDPLGTVRDLDGYRAKYRLYRSDPDLRAAHAAHPWAVIWDDHEFVDNFHRTTILEQPERSAAAFRAWWEYQPVWPVDGNRIHRRARWGDLVELTLLDTRQYRDPQPVDRRGDEIRLGSTLDADLRVVHHADRTILGPAQRDWLLDGLGAAQSDAITWKVIANQVMISPIRPVDLDEPLLRLADPDLPRNAGVYINFDDWDGYQADRNRLTEHLHTNRIDNVAVVTGDIHSFWQSPLLLDVDQPRSPAVAQEFVCGSISSRGVDYVGDLAFEAGRVARTFQPGFRYVDLARRGFGLVECTPDAASVEFHTVNALSPSAAAGVARRRARFDWAAGSDQLGLTRT